MYLKKTILVNKLILLAGLTTIFLSLDYFNFLFNTSVIGIDGYYYILQLDSVLKGEYLYFPIVTTLILYFLTGLSFLFGSPIFAIKVGAVFFHFSLCFALFSIIINLTKRFWLGVVAYVICGVSSFHLYLIVEYINYLGAICFLFWSLYFLILFTQRKRIIYLVIAFGCFILSIGSHRAIIPIILLFLILISGFLWMRNAVERNNKTQIIVCLLMFLLFFISPSLIALQPFFHLPINWMGEFSSIPHFPAKLTTFPELFILFGTSITILYFVFFRNKREENKTTILFFGSIALWSILITLNPFLPPDIGFDSIGGRLRVLAYIQIAVLVPATIWLLRNSYKNTTLYITIFVLPLMLWSFFNPLPRGAQPEYLARRIRLIEGLKTSPKQIEENSLIIAAHGEQFVVTAITNIPSQQLFPKENKYNSVYWLLNLIPPTLLDSSMTIVDKDRIGSYTVLVKDDEAFRRRLQNVDVRRVLRQSNKPLDAFLVENGYPW